MLDKVNDIDPLKKDKPRISLEAAIVSTGTAVILLYLIQEAHSQPYFRGNQKKIFQDGIKPAEPGVFGSRQGKISINPLEEVDYQPTQSKQDTSNNVLGQNNENNIGIDLNANNQLLNPKGKYLSDGFGRAGVSARTQFDDTFGSSINKTTSVASAKRNFFEGAEDEKNSPDSNKKDLARNYNEEQETDIRDSGTEKPKETIIGLSNQGKNSFIVVVKTKNSINSQSIDGNAKLEEILRQIGIEESSITYDSDADLAFEILSDQQGRFTARSLDDTAMINMINENIGSSKTHVTGTKDVIIDVADWIRINLDGKESELKLDQKTIGAKETTIKTNNNGLLGALDTNIEFEVWTPPNSNIKQTDISILSNALKNSQLITSEKDDILSITSSIEGVFNTDYLASERDNNDQLELIQQEVNIALSSQVLNNSLIDTGSGDDHLTISSTINPELISELEEIADKLEKKQRPDYLMPKNADMGSNQAGSISSNAVEIERIGTINSSIKMGEGNDFLRISGEIVNSNIDMGAGINHLVIENNIDAKSKIILGDKGSKLEYINNMNDLIKGGEGDELFIIGGKNNSGFIDGNKGSDTLESQSSLRKELKLNGQNKGTLEGVQFKNIENLNLGEGDDVAIIDFKTTLTGKLLGGEGLDRLDFSNWKDPINVDLIVGISTGVYGSRPMGVSEFEQVTGGEGSDIIASSASADRLEGSGGDDVLFHEWSPWLSNEKEGTELYGNNGQDIFVMSGLDQSIPNEWDGRFGLPTIKDLDLSQQPIAPGSETKYNDRVGLVAKTTNDNGYSNSYIQLLTPSDLNGIGDATKLPIGSVDKLFLGAENSNVAQLAIGLDTMDQRSGMLYYIDDSDKSPIAVAYIESTGQISI